VSAPEPEPAPTGGALMEVFGDLTCPFTYASLKCFGRRRDERGLDHLAVRVRSWPLEWVNGRVPRPEVVTAEVEALRESVTPELFGGFDAAALPASSIAAFGLEAAAYERSEATGEAVSLALREALFEHGLDIADPAVLRDVADRFGVVPPGPERSKELVEAAYEEGRARGVQGSPYIFVGAGSGHFCPALRIERQGDRFVVEPVPGAIDSVLDEAVAAMAGPLPAPGAVAPRDTPASDRARGAGR